MTDKKHSPKIKLAIIGDNTGSVARAIEEAKANGLLAEGVTPVHMVLSELGQGSGVPLPELNASDFLNGKIPWKWSGGPKVS